LWQAAAAAVDQGEFERNEAVRTALYTKATNYARRAVALNPGDPEGHFHLSRAIGRTALAAGPRERVKYGIEVREEALAALKLAPRHPGALHVMGVWHAEIMRLNGISRTVARAFLGGQVFGTASWAEALRHLELAVEIEPARLVHRLDLARIYRDLDRINDARAAYRAAIAAPASDPNDAVYRQHANDELKKLR
jgi:tetratricopeptide (TPR) repeat protein